MPPGKCRNKGHAGKLEGVAGTLKRVAATGFFITLACHLALRQVFITAMKIYHNPRCSKSRETLQILLDRGFEPEIILYLETPPSSTELATLVRDAGIDVRQAIRRGEAAYTELGLDNTQIDDKQLLEAMATHPKLIERPFVVTAKGTRLCRPPSLVEEIL